MKTFRQEKPNAKERNAETLSIKDQPKPKKRSKTSALLKITKQISTLKQTLNARMNCLEQSVWPPASNLYLYRLNKPDNLSDAISTENNTYDDGFGVDTRDQVDPYNEVSLSGGDISEEESTIHGATSIFDHSAGLSPNNGHHRVLIRRSNTPQINRLHLCKKLKRGTCLINRRILNIMNFTILLRKNQNGNILKGLQKF